MYTLVCGFRLITTYAVRHSICQPGRSHSRSHSTWRLNGALILCSLRGATALGNSNLVLHWKLLCDLRILSASWRQRNYYCSDPDAHFNSVAAVVVRVESSSELDACNNIVDFVSPSVTSFAWHSYAVHSAQIPQKYFQIYCPPVQIAIAVSA